MAARRRGRTFASVTPTCGACGKQLGVYEPVVWTRPCGPVHGSLLTLRLKDDFEPATAGLMHRDCHAAQDLE
jgi:hypothetical protein